MNKRIMSFMLAICMVLSTFSPTFAAASNLNVKPESLIKEENLNIDEKTEYPLIERYEDSKTETYDSSNTVTYVVEFKDGLKAKGLENLKRIDGLKVKYEYDLLFSGAAVEVSRANAAKIFDLEEVKEAQESKPVEPAMTDAKKVSKVVQALSNSEIADKYGVDGSGMVIATIDSGIDVTHKDLKLDPGVFKNKAKIKTIDKGNFTEKVPHGFNYVDANFNLKDDFYWPHGQHIAGILAGNASKEEEAAGTGIRGVAPNAQILAYKIFSDATAADNFQGTSGDDSVYHAMEDAIKHGADVISLSYGNPGVGRRGDIFYNAIEKAKEKGVVVVISMGNYGAASTENSYDDFSNNKFGLIDTSITVSGAASPNAIGVAASKNTGMLYNTITVNGKDYPCTPIGNDFVNQQKKFLESKTYQVRYMGRGLAEDYKNEDDLEGKIVAVSRGGEDVYKKVDRAIASGAIGFWLINDLVDKTRDTYLTEFPIYFEYMNMLDDSMLSQENIYACGLNGQFGKEIFNLSDDFAERKKPIDKDFEFTVSTKETKTYASFAETSSISGFSAWGPNNQLELKPDITAPGQDIKSLGNDNTYVQMSGTSMSAPHIAGISTLLLNKVNADMKNMSDFNKTELIKMLMMSTATPMKDVKTKGQLGALENSPRQQGAGLVDTEAAFKTNVVLSNDKKPSISLKEIGDNTEFTVTLHNFSNKEQTFEIEKSQIMTDGVIDVVKTNENGDKVNVHEIHPKIVEGATLTSPNEVSVKANSKTTIKFNLNATGDNQFIEGFIYFKAKDSNQPNLSIPYMGFKGDWGKERIVDAPVWDKDSKTGYTTILRADGQDNEGSPKYVQLGVDGMDSKNEINPDMIAVRSGIQVYPRIIALRDATDYEVNVLNSNKEEIQSLRKGHFYKKYIHSLFKERYWYPPQVLNPDAGLEWRGVKVNRNYTSSSPGGEKISLPEGQYYFELKFRSKDHGEFQTTLLPIKIDDTDPTFDNNFATIDKENNTLKVKVNDNFGISYLAGTLDGKEIKFERDLADKEYKTFIAKDFTLNGLTRNNLKIEARDFAGNRAKTEKNLVESAKIQGTNINEIKKSKESKVTLKGTFDKNEINQIEVVLNGKSLEAKITENAFEVELDLEKVNTLEIKFKKDNVVLYQDVEKIYRDSTVPKIEATYKLLENGKFEVKGKVIDEGSSFDNIECYYSPTNLPRAKKYPVVLNEKGEFEFVESVNNFYKIYLQAIDESGNKSAYLELAPGLDDNKEGDSDHTHAGSVGVNLGHSHSLIGGREVVYPNFPWLAFSNEQLAHHNPNLGEMVQWTSSIDGKEYTGRRVKVEYRGNAGDVLTVTSYNSVLNGYKPTEQPETQKFSRDGEVNQVDGLILPGFNHINLKVENNGKVVLDRGYTMHLDTNEPEIEFFNIEPRMYDHPDDGIDGVIYLNNEDFTIEGKAYDDSAAIHVKINDHKVETWYLHGERHQERRFSHTEHVQDGETLHVEVADHYGTTEKNKYKVVIDKEKPIVTGWDTNTTDILNIEFSDNNGIKESNVFVNGKPYTNGRPISDYQVDGNKYYIYYKAVDYAGNVIEDSKCIGIDEKLPEVTLKKDSFNEKEVKLIENIFNVPNGIKIKPIEYADKYESRELTDEWKDRDTIKPYKELDTFIPQKLGENKLLVLIEDIFGRQEIREYKLNIVEDSETSEPIKPTPIDPKPVNPIEDSELEKVKLKKEIFYSDELQKVENLFEIPEGVNIKIKDPIDASKEGIIKFKVEISKDGKAVEKEFEIQVKHRPLDPIVPINPINPEKPGNIDKHEDNNNIWNGGYLRPVIISEPKNLGKNIPKDNKVDFENKFNTKNSKSNKKNIDDFIDLKGHWAREYITNIVNAEIMNGVSDTKFAPDEGLNRAMFITIIRRLSKDPINENYEVKAKDVKKNDYFAESLDWAVKNNVFKIKNDTFNGNELLSRAEMAEILYNYTQYKKLKVEKLQTVKINDLDKVSEDKRKAVEEVVKYGLIIGKENGKFDPNAKLTRAETAVIVDRLMKVK